MTLLAEKFKSSRIIVVANVPWPLLRDDLKCNWSVLWLNDKEKKP